ncbi:MAG: heparinase II/III family protein [Planctomycetes bacterium]|nr:heparinase II/III family protein [Planctomycetota bacterium]
MKQRVRRREAAILVLAFVATFAAAPLRGAGWTPPSVALPDPLAHPAVACTPAELAHLRAAWRGADPERSIVAGVIRRADGALRAPLEFPPRGGQHNQWYQCEKCQLGLQTVDATHHRCPRCKTVYSGEPYDDVIFSRVHGRNLSGMDDAAWAFAITGDAKYAAHARRVLLGYARRYRDYPYHTAARQKPPRMSRSGGHLFEQTLNEASSMTRSIAPAYDLVHDALSAEDREAIRTGLLLPMLENIDKHKAGKGNWQTWHNAAFVWGGGALGDAAWVRKAILDPSNGFAYQMEVSVSSDGMWYENSWGYHYYTLSAMVAIAEGARRLGVDLWGHPALRKMIVIPLEYRMPDGSLPRFGDDVRASADGAAGYLELLLHARPDPALVPYLSRRPTWDSVLLGRAIADAPAPAVPVESKVFAGAGHAILRTGGDAGLAAALTFGPYGGFHGHFDKLSFVFFGLGRELGVDPGRARSQAYRLPIHGGWYKATISHNAIIVDGASQKPAEGALTVFGAAADHAVAVARCDAAYPGVRHERLLCLMPAYLLVVDDLAAGKERQFDWLYHNRGARAALAGAEEAGDADALRGIDGAEYVQDLRRKETGDGIRVAFEGDGIGTHLVLAGAPDTAIAVGTGPGGSVLDRIPMVIVTRRGERQRFAAAIEPIAAGKAPAVTSVAIEECDGGIRATVIRGGAADRVTRIPGRGVTIESRGRTVLSAGER